MSLILIPFVIVADGPIVQVRKDENEYGLHVEP